MLANSDKINYRLNNILDNWEKNPIKSIQLPTLDKSSLINNIDLDSNHSLIYERLSGFNYKTIFYDNRYKVGKICGKDCYGNDLYFPLDIECPLNDIVLTKDENFDKNGIYTKLELNNSFLYYTNKKIDGKIIINLIKSKHNVPELNFQESEEKEKYVDFDIKSYSNIGSYNEFYFLSIYYIGIDKDILPRQEKIKEFEKKIKKYEYLIEVVDSLLLAYYIAFGLACLIFFSLRCAGEIDCRLDLFFIGFDIIFIIFFIPILIMSSICLYLNHQYIINFINKINQTYENNRVTFPWETLIISHIIIVIIILIFNNIYFCCTHCFENFFDKIFICNLCKYWECKTCKCDCDFGQCECSKCLKDCKCDCDFSCCECLKCLKDCKCDCDFSCCECLKNCKCDCDCFKCFRKDNENNHHIPNIHSENINISNNIDTTNEIISLKNMISNMIESNNNNYKNIKQDIDEIKNKISNKNNFLNNLEKNNNLQNNHNVINNKLNEEIIQIKKEVREIKDLCKNCSEKFENNNNTFENIKKNDNVLKIIIKFENKIYQIILENDCSYKDFIKKIYSTLSSYLNGISINSLKFYYWNQLRERIKIMNENDFLNAMSMNIFYFEVLIEGHNQVRQQNYINNENK